MKIRMNANRNIKTLLAASIVCGGLGVPTLATADNVPLSYVADPAVYKLLAENELFRVVVATWKPGQRDVYHSHSANAAYRLVDCNMRAHGLDGKVQERQNKAGTVLLQAAVPSHSLENIGTTDCQVVIVERK